MKEVNDKMGQYLQDNQNSKDYSLNLNTANNHRQILSDYSKEYSKTKNIGLSKLQRKLLFFGDE